MPYLTQKKIIEAGFKSFGKNIKISSKASIYNCDQIEIGFYIHLELIGLT